MMNSNTEQPPFKPNQEDCNVILKREFADSELVIGLVGAVGTKLEKVIEVLSKRLKDLKYTPEVINVSSDLILPWAKEDLNSPNSEYERIKHLMDLGNKARIESGEDSILALGCSALISSRREKEGELPKFSPRKVFIIKSLKHPAEIVRLRQIYPHGFYMIGVHCSRELRMTHLTDAGKMSEDEAEKLVLRDEHESFVGGQRVREAFHLSDAFVHMNENNEKLEKELWRFLMILFAHPYVTPTFDEYAMFLAFAASLRSADLSRQVGAVIANNREVIATGANDCPKFGGGLYWPEDEEMSEGRGTAAGRDYSIGYDSNVMERRKIVDDIVSKLDKDSVPIAELRKILNESRIRDITEFGRSVHAEMEALLCCARNNLSTRNATLYSTTFPCHNCAKHIVAAGIKRVVYVEPYPKSKAAELHRDSIKIGLEQSANFVSFEAFVGVGPRNFFELFSMQLGSGTPVKRKDDLTGEALKWVADSAQMRLQMRPFSYLDLETAAAYVYSKFTREEKN